MLAGGIVLGKEQFCDYIPTEIIKEASGRIETAELNGRHQAWHFGGKRLRMHEPGSLDELIDGTPTYNIPVTAARSNYDAHLLACHTDIGGHSQTAAESGDIHHAPGGLLSSVDLSGGAAQ